MLLLRCGSACGTLAAFEGTAPFPSRICRMTRSPIRRLIFSVLRRVLYFWVRSETINQSAFTLKLDRSKPVF